MSVIAIPLMVLASMVTGAEPADEPLPDITGKALAKKIKACWPSYASGRLEIDYEVQTDDIAQRESNLIKRPGKNRFVTDGRRWRLDVDEMGPLRPNGERQSQRTSAGFDGTDRYEWDERANLLILGAFPSGNEILAVRETLWYHGDSLLESLAAPTTTVGQRTVNGQRCYLAVTKEAELDVETAISPRQGYLPVLQSEFHHGTMVSTRRFLDIREVAPGVWVPGQIFSLVRDDPWRKSRVLRMSDRRLSRVRFEPRTTFDDQAFQFKVPLRATVSDQRLGYWHYNDPWWPELGTFLRERFDWPKASLRTLRKVATHSNVDLQGKLAPPIQAAAWIGSQPLDWERLRGKVTLVAFWSVKSKDCGSEAAVLRRVHEAFQGAGFEVLLLHAPTDDPEEVRRFARDFRIAFPIALDRKSGESGATAQAYGVTADIMPSAFLVDQEGKVHSLPRDAQDGGPFLDKLRSLLPKAGADAATAKLGGEPPSPRMTEALQKELERLTAASTATGRIQGTIRDGQGRVITGGTVNSTLQFTMLYAGEPNGYMTFKGRRSAATTGPDGRFELSGLCKGSYQLVCSAEGKAGVEVLATIGPELGVATAEAILEQGDAIEGVVRDERGQAVAGARVVPNVRRLVKPDGSVHTSVTQHDGATTDAEGRFHLRRLLTGEHTLDITAQGFGQATLEHIPAGTTGVTASVIRTKAK